MGKAPIPPYKYMICTIEKHTKTIYSSSCLSPYKPFFLKSNCFFIYLYILFQVKESIIFKSFSPYKQCRLAREYSQVAGLVVSWGRRAKLLSITPENSVDGVYRLKRATQSVPQLRHLLLVILFGSNQNKLQVIFLLLFPTI